MYDLMFVFVVHGWFKNISNKDGEKHKEKILWLKIMKKKPNENNDQNKNKQNEQS